MLALCIIQYLPTSTNKVNLWQDSITTAIEQVLNLGLLYEARDLYHSH